MRQKLPIIALLAVAGCIVLAVSVIAQSKGEKESEYSKPDEEARTYLSVTAAEMERNPKKFRGQYVQMTDYFGEELSDREQRRIMRDVRMRNVSRDTHIAFATHKAIGSNAVCLVRRDDEAGRNVLKTLSEESPIFLRGRIGPMTSTSKGSKPVLLIDQIVRGHTPPPPVLSVKSEKKPVVLIVEYAVETADGKIVPRPHGRYPIPKSGQRYVIPDPYDPKKVIYVTIEY